MPTGLRRCLIPVLAAAVFAPAVATLWVGLHVATHHDQSGHHDESAHHDESRHHHEAAHQHEVEHEHEVAHEHSSGHQHAGHQHAGHQHAGHQQVAGHQQDAGQHHDSGHPRHHYDGAPHHHHVTPDPRHEPAVRRGLVSAPATTAQAALPVAVLPPRPSARASGTSHFHFQPAHRGPPTPLFASHCALLL